MNSGWIYSKIGLGDNITAAKIDGGLVCVVSAMIDTVAEKANSDVQLILSKSKVATDQFR